TLSDRVEIAGHDGNRDAYGGEPVRAQARLRSEYAAGQGLEVVDPPRSGKLVEHLGGRIVHALVAAHPPGDQLRTVTFTPASDPTQYGPADSVRMSNDSFQPDPGAHGVAEVLGVGDVQVVEQPRDVVGHGAPGVGCWVVRLVGAPVAAAVQTEHKPAGGGQCFLPPGANPVQLVVAAEAMNEDDWAAVVGPGQLVVEAHPVGHEIGHRP